MKTSNILFVTLALVMGIPGIAVAKQVPIKFEIPPKDPKDPGKDKAPLRIPEVAASYDAPTHVLKVVCEKQAEGEVYLYDLNGTLEGFSPVLNCELDVPSTGAIHVLYIDGGGWTVHQLT